MEKYISDHTHIETRDSDSNRSNVAFVDSTPVFGFKLGNRFLMKLILEIE